MVKMKKGYRLLGILSLFIMVLMIGAVAGSVGCSKSSKHSSLASPHAPYFDITTYGAISGGDAVTNQTAINAAIDAAAAAGGIESAPIQAGEASGGNFVDPPAVKETYRGGIPRFGSRERGGSCAIGLRRTIG